VRARPAATCTPSVATAHSATAPHSPRQGGPQLSRQAARLSPVAARSGGRLDVRCGAPTDRASLLPRSIRRKVSEPAPCSSRDSSPLAPLTQPTTNAQHSSNSSRQSMPMYICHHTILFLFLYIAWRDAKRQAEPRPSTRLPASICASTKRQPMGVNPDVNLRRPASTCVDLSVDATMHHVW
jgi:hypothetical protein